MTIAIEQLVASEPPTGSNQVGVVYVNADGQLVVQYNDSILTLEDTLTGPEIVTLLEALGVGSRLSHTKLDDIGTDDHHAKEAGQSITHTHPAGFNISGEEGDEGQQGPPGLTGASGAMGIVGPPGIQGDQGEDGADSIIPGPQGLQGVVGQMGMPGIDGEGGEDVWPGIPASQDAATLTSGILDGDRLPVFSVTKKAGVPATGIPSGKYLKDDGTWATISVSGATEAFAVAMAVAL